MAIRSRRRHNREEMINIINTMTCELDQRASDAASSHAVSEMHRRIDIAACQHAARHLREVLGIAQGRRSAAYWQHRANHRPLRLAS